MFIARRGKQRHRFETRQQALAFARANPLPGQPWDVQPHQPQSRPGMNGGKPRADQRSAVREVFADASKGRMFGRSTGGWC